eukprot:1140639-Pelagomonas_calceolata.AAC.1
MHKGTWVFAGLAEKGGGEQVRGLGVAVFCGCKYTGSTLLKTCLKVRQAFFNRALSQSRNHFAAAKHSLLPACSPFLIHLSRLAYTHTQNQMFSPLIGCKRAHHEVPGKLTVTLAVTWVQEEKHSILQPSLTNGVALCKAYVQLYAFLACLEGHPNTGHIQPRGWCVTFSSWGRKLGRVEGSVANIEAIGCLLLHPRHCLLFPITQVQQARAVMTISSSEPSMQACSGSPYHGTHMDSR